MGKIYAGIGSRQVPPEIEMLCRQIAVMLRAQGWHLRSGHAIGCDQAFERGAREDATVFLPWKDYEDQAPLYATGVQLVPSIASLETVAKYHPAVERLSMAAIRLHGRNAHIILGDKLDDPVDQVVCWTPNEKRGGTSQALRIAEDYGIPVHNLNDPLVAAEFKRACWDANAGP